MKVPDIIARANARPNRARWRVELAGAFRRPADLLDWLQIPPADRPALADSGFRMLVPKGFAARMRQGDPADPLLAQVLPRAEEQESVAGYGPDPVGDLASRQGSGVLHKYRGRVLFVATGACAVHCRYCFRREFPYSEDNAGRDHWQAALGYVAANKDIEEVILSGGDPFMLDTTHLEALTSRLARLTHIRRLRIHTRMPVVLPERVDDELCRWLRRLPWPVIIVIHANHEREIDAGVARALARLRRCGAHLLNQVVLLSGVNDSPDALAGLMRRTMDAGVIPYYLHLLDRVTGSARFEVDEERARALIEQLRIELPGYLVPRLVRERAGMPYKQPIL